MAQNHVKHTGPPAFCFRWQTFLVSRDTNSRNSGIIGTHGSKPGDSLWALCSQNPALIQTTLQKITLSSTFEITSGNAASSIFSFCCRHYSDSTHFKMVRQQPMSSPPKLRTTFPADHLKPNSTIYSLITITAPASQQTPQLQKRPVALCCVIKLHILEWPFIAASLRHTCAIIMLSNQHLDMPHLWGGWIISAKEKCSLTQI